LPKEKSKVNVWQKAVAEKKIIAKKVFILMS